MSVCHIIGAGQYTDVKPNKKPGDVVIVCDGGLRYAEKYGVAPDLIVGDFDSLGFVPEGANVVRLPVKKDVTDVGAALGIAEKTGYDEYRLYCCGGGRISHTIANLQNLLPLAKRGKKVYLYDEKEVLTILSNGSIAFPAAQGVFSLFSLGTCHGVTVTGALYPLQNADLTEDFPLGVSNEFIAPTTLSLRSGTLLLAFPLASPLPLR